MSVAYLFAWLLPLFTGTGLWWLAGGALRSRGGLVASLGTGWVIGLFIAASCARWNGAADTAHAFLLAAPWVAAIGLLAWIGAVARLLRAGAGSSRSSMADATEGSTPSLATLVWWLLFALIVARVWLLADEAALRPVFPWDAWSAWAVKPKTWMLLGHADAFVAMPEWLSHPLAPTHTAMAWNYPELLAWIQVWFASAAGGWNEPLVDLAWTGALTALALAMYGYLRGFGVGALAAMAVCYAFVSLPLVDAHVALAGYADLWLAVTLGMAVMAWTRWMLWRERGQWLLGVGLALCLPAIKLEGSVWLLAFSAVVVLDLLPARWRWRAAVGVVALAVVGLLVGGFALPMLGLGWVRIAWGSVDVAAIARFQLAWHPVGGAVSDSLFALPNWHLLWYAFPLLVIARVAVIFHSHAARMVGLLTLIQLAILFVLFFLTPASQWAQDFTSANRLVMQIVPTVLVFAALLLREGGAGSMSGRSFSPARFDRPRGLARPISPM